LESRGWLADQTRFVQQVSPMSLVNSQVSPGSRRVFSSNASIVKLKDIESTCNCSGNAPGANPVNEEPIAGCGCGQTGQIKSSDPVRNDIKTAAQKTRVTPGIFLKELYNDGKRLLVMFLGFAFIGYFLNGLIPASWITALFGGDNIYNVPLAATLGLPFYINSEASLPLISALLDNGMSQGAALAFLIAGSGTSIGAITGALTIARWRVVGLVIGILWLGAILSGLAFNLLLALKLF
jgi:uncharacterized membrane protein YraQ (UPF0718 family)